MRFLVLLVLDIDLAEEAESRRWLIIGSEKVIFESKFEWDESVAGGSVRIDFDQNLLKETLDIDELVIS